MGGKRTFHRYIRIVTRSFSPVRDLFLRLLRTSAAVTVIVTAAACDEAKVLGGIDRPDLAYAVSEASNQVEPGVEAALFYEDCRKQEPIVEPVRQKWFCRFGFRTPRDEHHCSAIVSVHGDDHVGIWKPDHGDINPSGEVNQNLKCASKSGTTP
jgi:hypothetical protein